VERNTENEIQDLESKESKWPWDTGIFPIIYQFITRLWQVQKRVGGAAVDILPSHVECYRYPCEQGILAIQKAKQKVEKANSWQRENSLPDFTDHLTLVRMKESVIDFFFFYCSILTMMRVWPWEDSKASTQRIITVPFYSYTTNFIKITWESCFCQTLQIHRWR